MSLTLVCVRVDLVRQVPAWLAGEVNITLSRTTRMPLDANTLAARAIKRKRKRRIVVEVLVS